jgi:Prokaryotic metallothionein
MQTMTACAHEGCSCRVEDPKAFVQDGETYCSSACAAGKGCDHGDCNCSTAAREPARDSRSAKTA